MSQYGHRIHNVDLADHFGITMKHLTEQNAPYAASMEKIGIQINNTLYIKKRKINNFVLIKTSAAKHSPPTYVYYIEFYFNLHNQLH